MITPSLQPAAQLLHRELVNALRQIFVSGNKDMDMLLSSAVTVSDEYLQKLYALIPCEGFADPDEEIYFFKYSKPLFAAEREYHHRLYYAFMFGDDDEKFRSHEIRRMEKILTENSGFVEYYHGGHSYNDYPWFSQGQAPLPTSLTMLPWETNPRHTSARDAWVAGLIAVERYRDWLIAKQPDEKNI